MSLLLRHSDPITGPQLQRWYQRTTDSDWESSSGARQSNARSLETGQFRPSEQNHDSHP
ncbi:MAG: hypothetical protein KC800_11830 [Candidatus Eremiobacteraeota bacterium]|nr:hypothetical protein [Candidatus Eremiobacteraeota bacterium]